MRLMLLVVRFEQAMCVSMCVCVFLTSLRVCVGSLGSPGASLYIAPLLQCKHKASIANHHLASVQTLKDPLLEGGREGGKEEERDCVSQPPVTHSGLTARLCWSWSW